MTANRRILLNILATYGRGMFAMVLGLFSARWVLMTLGEVDFGLNGLIGGLSAFVTFFNGILAVSVSRFYAVSVGRARASSEDGDLEDCRKWFSIALCLHGFLGIALVAIGYPVGIWLVRNWLTIPPGRVETCVWLFRFVCLSCLMAMVNVPFNAMYKAKQYIAELTVYGFATTLINFCFLCYMISHPGDWLLRYGLWQCLLGVTPQLIITVRACQAFPECRFRPRSIVRGDVRRLLSFTGWNFFGILGNLIRSRSLALVVNRFLGPAQNATLTVASNLSGHMSVFSGSLRGAFLPAIANAYGAGDMARVTTLFYGICKFSSLLTLVVAIPVCSEVHEVMRLWLGCPPVGSAELGMFIIVTLVMEQMTMGHWMILSASGRIALYQFLVGMCFCSALPIAWLTIGSGMGIMAVGHTLVVTLAAAVVVRLFMVRRNLGIAPWRWIGRIFLPTVFVSALAFLAGLVPRLFMSASFARIVVSSIAVEAVFLPLVWAIVLDRSERDYVSAKAVAFLRKARRLLCER